MNIVITGSLGNISKPLAETLVQKGHSVTVISSKPERQKDIEALGAKAAIGSMKDTGFLTNTFKGADAVYIMETLGRDSFFNHHTDVIAEVTQIGRNYKEAIEKSGVKNVVHLSSIGGHTDKNTGLLLFHYNVEQILQTLPAGVSVKTMRPVGFYYNTLAFIPGIKTQGAIFGNYEGDVKEPWVSTSDIAAVIAEEMELPFNGSIIRYIASDELTPNEVATILGEAIGKPETKWIQVSDEQILNTMVSIGMNPVTAKAVVEMNAARRNGTLYADYNKHRPVLGKVKLKEYAKEFAKAYNQ